MNAKLIRWALVIAAIALLAAPVSRGQSFSLSALPSLSGLPSPSGLPDNIFLPGPAPIFFGAGAILGAAYVEVDGLDYSRVGIKSFSTANVAGYQFSVSVFSGPGVGVGAVGAEAAAGDHTADIFMSDGTGSNLLLWDGNGVTNPGLPAAGALGLLEPGIDDVDAWANIPAPAYLGLIFYSVDSISAAAAYGPAFSGADVYVVPPIPAPIGYDAAGGPVPSAPIAAVYASAVALFLDGAGPNTDDIDALVVLDDGDFAYSGAIGVDWVLFSLRPGSMSLAMPSPYVGASPGDILFANTAGSAGIFMPAGALGLLPTADLNALDIVLRPSAISIFESGGPSVDAMWSYLDPLQTYTVEVASASLPLTWIPKTTITPTTTSLLVSDTSPTNSSQQYRLIR